MNDLANNPERQAKRARRTKNPGGKLKTFHCCSMAINLPKSKVNVCNCKVGLEMTKSCLCFILFS